MDMTSNENLIQMQQERTARARAGLAKGEFKFSTSDSGWQVVNGDGKQYAVSLTTCTCQDFTDRGEALGLRCKHIEAARILFSNSPQGENMEGNTTQFTAWIRLYHPSGAQVSLPVPLFSRLTAQQATDMFGSVGEYLNVGFLANAPDPEDIEQIEEINAVARREAKDETPIIDFYSSNMKLHKKVIHVYMNTEQDVAGFEDATGLKLAALPLYDGALAIARDDNKARKYIVNLPRPIRLVWKLSLKWEEWKAAGGEGNEPHKRMLVRYESGLPAVKGESAPSPVSTALTATRSYLDGTHVNGDLNERAAYDAFKKANGKNPDSKAALKTWTQANKHLVEFPVPNPQKQTHK
jgi:predicted nucleic acid-binding Zn finger protein